MKKFCTVHLRRTRVTGGGEESESSWTSWPTEMNRNKRQGGCVSEADGHRLPPPQPTPREGTEESLKRDLSNAFADCMQPAAHSGVRASK